MDKQKLIEYLERVVELEKQRYIQERTIEELENEISSLGIKNNYCRQIAKVKQHTINTSWAPGLGMVVGGIVFFSGLKDCRSVETFFEKGLLAIGVALACAIIPAMIAGAIAKSSEKSELAEKQRLFDEEYNDAVQQDEIRVAEETKRKTVLQINLDLIEQQHERTMQALQEFYSAGPIYRKYHFDFVAVASFLDYLKSGMCQTLEERVSRDGAYNIYEELCRLDKIIYKLDEVINHLEEIKANQWTIYNAVQEGNRISEQLVDATNRLAAASEQTAINSGIAAENSAIAAYNSRQSANELNQIKWLQLYGMTLR